MLEPFHAPMCDKLDTPGLTKAFQSIKRPGVSGGAFSHSFNGDGSLQGNVNQCSLSASGEAHHALKPHVTPTTSVPSDVSGLELHTTENSSQVMLHDEDCPPGISPIVAAEEVAECNTAQHSECPDHCSSQ